MALHNNRWTVGKVGNIDTGINSSLGHGGGEKSQEERGNITITEILLISQSPQEEVEHLSLLMLLFVGVPCETSPFSSRERWHGKVTSSVFSFLFFFFLFLEEENFGFRDFLWRIFREIEEMKRNGKLALLDDRVKKERKNDFFLLNDEMLKYLYESFKYLRHSRRIIDMFVLN